MQTGSSSGIRSSYDAKLALSLIGVDVVLIAGGIAAAATSGTVSWGAFGVSGVAYLALVYGLLVSLPWSASAAEERTTVLGDD